MNKAKKLWICDLQKTFSFSVEFNKMRESLGVYEHQDRYLRSKDRLDRGKLPFDTKLPILLSNSHHFIDLVIQSAHEKAYHNGVRETLLDLSSKYWIPRENSRQMFIVQKIRRITVSITYISDLPKLRVIGGQTLKAAKTDLCGSVYTKVHPKSKEMTESYISIATCEASRTLHLEISPDQFATAYLRSQRRFIERGGIPKLIVTDNGKTFKGRD